MTPIRCPLCDDTLDTQSTLRRHWLDYHGLTDEETACLDRYVRIKLANDRMIFEGTKEA